MKYSGIALLLCLSLQGFCQSTYQSLTMDFLYANHIYYSFENGETANASGKTWNLGFSVPGRAGGGVFFNEYAERDLRGAVMQAAPTNNFNDVFTIADLVGQDSLRNEETNWLSGAFNLQNDPTNSADYGWGTYEQGRGVIGNKVYAVALPDSSYKKLMLDSLTEAGVYYFRYANLDGSNLVSKSFNINDYPDQTLVHYSIVNDAFVQVEPSDWDLLFTRYIAYTNFNGGADFVNYNVTGVLTNHGVEVAELDGVGATSTIEPEDYIGALILDNDAIGHDWKEFFLDDFVWILDFDRAYVLRLPDGRLGILRFIDFEGAFSGVIVIEQAGFEPVASSNVENVQIENLAVFPNPSHGALNLVYYMKQNQENLNLKINNLLGQCVYNGQLSAKQGLNAQRLDLDLPAGQYSVSIQATNDRLSKRLVVVN